MTWRPSTRDPGEWTNPLWQALEPAYDRAYPVAPLPRDDRDGLSRQYVLPRRGDESVDLVAFRSRLPPSLQRFPLGKIEIDVLDFLINYKRDRVLYLTGTRGAGKTSLVHYIESVCEQCEWVRHPCFFIVDFLRLPSFGPSQPWSEEGTDRAGVELFIAELRNELKCRLETVPEPIRTALANALKSLRRSRGLAAVRAFSQKLASYLRPDQLRRVVFVFDNLDELPGHVISLALEVAKELYVSGGVACVVSLRHASARGSFGRGDARAFGALSVVVQPPSLAALLDKLAERLADAVSSLEQDTGARLLAYGQPLDPATIHRFVTGLKRELADRRGHDDVVALVDVVAADDMRHAIRLIRRVLAHRSLPGGELLAGKEPARSFHPLPALFEGSNLVFRGDAYVPNLLTFPLRAGGDDFLLPVRILRVLGEDRWSNTLKVLRIVEEMGYRREDIIRCLDALHRSLLVATSDMDIVNMAGPLPEALSLSVAGAYYKHTGLRLVDYLTCAVLDVALKHSEIRHHWETSSGREVPFWNRVVSLIEYTEEVRRREEQQIHHLTTRPPSAELQALAEMLRRDALLTCSLAAGLRSLAERGSQTPGRIGRIREIIAPLEKWIEGAERRLAEIANRGRRGVVQPGCGIRQRLGAFEWAFKPEINGDAHGVAVEIRSTEKASGAFVALADESGKFARAGVAIPRHRSEDGHGLVVPFVPIDQMKDYNLENVRPQAVMWKGNGNGRRTAFLVATEQEGVLSVKLSVPSGSYMRDVEIGAGVEIGKAREKAKEHLDRVGLRVTSGQLTANDIVEVGADLAGTLLSQNGQHLLMSCERLADDVLIFGSSEEMAFPWEWLRPPVCRGEPQRAIWEYWRAIRWRAGMGNQDDHLHVRQPEHNCAGVLATVGLERSGLGWRVSGVSDVAGVAELGRQREALHIVGVYKEGEVRVIGGPTIRMATARAHSFGRGCIVLSACSVGAAPLNESIPAEIAYRSGCTVWSPLVSIEANNADEVDRSMAVYLRKRNGRRGSLDGFFRETGRVLERLYVAYGVCR